MNQQTNVIDLQHQTTTNARSVLDEIVREGARRMLQAAIEEEVAAWCCRWLTLYAPEPVY